MNPDFFNAALYLASFVNSYDLCEQSKNFDVSYL